MVQEVTVSKAEADEARAAAESATPRMQATSRFGVCCLPALIAFLCMHKTCFPKLKRTFGWPACA